MYIYTVYIHVYNYIYIYIVTLPCAVASFMKLQPLAALAPALARCPDAAPSGPSVSSAQQRRLQTRTMYSMVTRKNKASSGDLN